MKKFINSLPGPKKPKAKKPEAEVTDDSDTPPNQRQRAALNSAQVSDKRRSTANSTVIVSVDAHNVTTTPPSDHVDTTTVIKSSSSEVNLTAVATKEDLETTMSTIKAANASLLDDVDDDTTIPPAVTTTVPVVINTTTSSRKPEAVQTLGAGIFSGLHNTEMQLAVGFGGLAFVAAIVVIILAVLYRRESRLLAAILGTDEQKKKIDEKTTEMELQRQKVLQGAGPTTASSQRDPAAIQVTPDPLATADVEPTLQANSVANDNFRVDSSFGSAMENLSNAAHSGSYQETAAEVHEPPQLAAAGPLYETIPPIPPAATDDGSKPATKFFQMDLYGLQSPAANYSWAELQQKVVLSIEFSTGSDGKAIVKSVTKQDRSLLEVP